MLARANSLVLAQEREQERIGRKSRKAVADSQTTVVGAAASGAASEGGGADGASDVDGASDADASASDAETESIVQAAMAEVKAAEAAVVKAAGKLAAEGDSAGEQIADAARSLRRTATRVATDVEGAAVSGGVELARTTSAAAARSVKKLRSFISQAPTAEPATKNEATTRPARPP